MEGAEDLEVMVRAGKEVVEIFYNMSMADHTGSSGLLDLWKKEDNFPMQELGEQALNKASYRKKSDGVLGILKTWSIELDSLKNNQLGDLILVLDEIEKPGNLGAILRSAEALGASTIILSDAKVDLFNPNVVRSSRGLLGRIAIASGLKEEVCAWISDRGFQCVATSSKASKLSHEYPYVAKTALVFGSESEGLGNFWKEKIHEWVRLQMLGQANSLNLNASLACIINDYNRNLRRI